MKIFVLLPRIPFPLEKGDKLRAFNQIKQLAKRNEIVLCALNDNPKVNEQDAFRALQPYCQSINFIKISKPQILLGLVRAFCKGLPLQCGYFYNRKAARKIDALIAKHKPDMLFGQLLRVAGGGPAVAAASPGSKGRRLLRRERALPAHHELVLLRRGSDHPGQRPLLPSHGPARPVRGLHGRHRAHRRKHL